MSDRMNAIRDLLTPGLRGLAGEIGASGSSCSVRGDDIVLSVTKDGRTVEKSIPIDKGNLYKGRYTETADDIRQEFGFERVHTGRDA